MLIHRNLLKLHKCASDDPARWQLTGVHIEKNGERVEACATDGKVLVFASHSAIPDELPGEPGESPREVTIPTERAKDITRALKGRRVKPVLEYFRLRGDVCDIVDNEFAITVTDSKSIEGQFPDCKSAAWPSRMAGVSLQMNPWRLIQALQTLCDVHDSKKSDQCRVKLEIHEKEGHPIRLEWTGEQPGAVNHSVAYVMPIVQL